MQGDAVSTGPLAGRRWVAVAHLLRPQGRRGELLADPLTDQAEVFQAGRSFRLATDKQSPDGAPTILLEDSWSPQGRNAGRLVLKLSGVDSISAAEALEQKILFLLESDLPALEPDTFLVRDLVGCTLIDTDRPVGTIVELQFPVGADGRTRLIDAVDLLVVQPEGTTDEADLKLVPFAKAWLISVDLEARRIVMQLPPGLLD